MTGGCEPKYLELPDRSAQSTPVERKKAPRPGAFLFTKPKPKPMRRVILLIDYYGVWF